MADVSSSPLRAVLFKTQSSNSAGSFAKFYAKRIRQHLDPGDETPAMVRFALIDQNSYSHCLGRSARERVFAAPLGLLQDVSVQAAATYSGYSSANPVDPKLFVFIFQPDRPDEVIRASWTDLMQQADRLLTEADPCPHA
jgi:hypothetical protein